MLKLGEWQELKIVKKVAFGVYLQDGQAEQQVLLPQKEVPQEAQVGDMERVFLYKDSRDRLIATMRTPGLTLGRIGLLKVKEVGKIGAFLEWGLEKDLLLPFREQTRKVREGEECLAALYIDKSQRLCATMNVYPYLRKDSPYQAGDQVKGRIYETSDNFGVFVAVDDLYSALIPKQEAAGQFSIGDVIEARVTRVKEDGKLNLSVREKAYLQIDKDVELVKRVIAEFDGVLPFNDKVSPEIIQREFGLSKNAFKRAVGRLLKQGEIEITENRILGKERMETK
ncbi:MAG: S1-like domain-containing RNA-binding protein [Lachnospiraceae bacterium]|nr:S1-like domain-containing RNA-binding protein [Lachnospiraceae bacterium]